MAMMLRRGLKRPLLRFATALPYSHNSVLLCCTHSRSLSSSVSQQSSPSTDEYEVSFFTKPLGMDLKFDSTQSIVKIDRAAWREIRPQSVLHCINGKHWRECVKEYRIKTGWISEESSSSETMSSDFPTKAEFKHLIEFLRTVPMPAKITFKYPNAVIDGCPTSAPDATFNSLAPITTQPPKPFKSMSHEEVIEYLANNFDRHMQVYNELKNRDNFRAHHGGLLSMFHSLETAGFTSFQPRIETLFQSLKNQIPGEMLTKSPGMSSQENLRSILKQATPKEEKSEMEARENAAKRNLTETLTRILRLRYCTVEQLATLDAAGEITPYNSTKDLIALIYDDLIDNLLPCEEALKAGVSGSEESSEETVIPTLKESQSYLRNNRVEIFKKISNVLEDPKINKEATRLFSNVWHRSVQSTFVRFYFGLTMEPSLVRDPRFVGNVQWKHEYRLLCTLFDILHGPINEDQMKSALLKEKEDSLVTLAGLEAMEKSPLFVSLTQQDSVTEENPDNQTLWYLSACNEEPTFLGDSLSVLFSRLREERPVTAHFTQCKTSHSHRQRQVADLLSDALLGSSSEDDNVSLFTSKPRIRKWIVNFCLIHDHSFEPLVNALKNEAQNAHVLDLLRNVDLDKIKEEVIKHDQDLQSGVKHKANQSTSFDQSGSNLQRYSSLKNRNQNLISSDLEEKQRNMEKLVSNQVQNLHLYAESKDGSGSMRRMKSFEWNSPETSAALSNLAYWMEQVVNIAVSYDSSSPAAFDYLTDHRVRETMEQSRASIAKCESSLEVLDFIRSHFQELREIMSKKPLKKMEMTRATDPEKTQNLKSFIDFALNEAGRRGNRDEWSGRKLVKATREDLVRLLNQAAWPNLNSGQQSLLPEYLFDLFSVQNWNDPRWNDSSNNQESMVVDLEDQRMSIFVGKSMREIIQLLDNVSDLNESDIDPSEQKKLVYLVNEMQNGMQSEDQSDDNSIHIVKGLEEDSTLWDYVKRMLDSPPFSDISGNLVIEESFDLDKWQQYWMQFEQNIYSALSDDNLDTAVSCLQYMFQNEMKSYYSPTFDLMLNRSRMIRDSMNLFDENNEYLMSKDQELKEIQSEMKEEMFELTQELDQELYDDFKPQWFQWDDEYEKEFAHDFLQKRMKGKQCEDHLDKFNSMTLLMNARRMDLKKEIDWARPRKRIMKETNWFREVNNIVKYGYAPYRQSDGSRSDIPSHGQVFAEQPYRPLKNVSGVDPDNPSMNEDGTPMKNEIPNQFWVPVTDMDDLYDMVKYDWDPYQHREEWRRQRKAKEMDE